MVFGRKLAAFQLDSKTPSVSIEKYAYNETRYTMLTRFDPKAAERLLIAAQHDADARFKLYEYMASMPGNGAGKEDK